MSLLFLWFILTSTTLVHAIPCIDNSSLFQPNSTFDTNRRFILSSLPKNVISHYGFYNGAIGEPPNKIFAAGMCISGTEEQACQGCLVTASNLVLDTCLQEKKAHVWGVNSTICMVRYSDTAFDGTLELEPHREFHSNHGFKTKETEFSRVWSGLTERMIEEASSSIGPTYHAADVEALPDSQRLYALMQCTPDLSPAQCNRCLKESVKDYQKCCFGRQGGSIGRLSCAFKAELYPFGGAFHTLSWRFPSPSPQSQPPPPSPQSQPPLPSPQSQPPPPPLSKTDRKKIPVGTIAAIVILTLVIVIIFLILLARRFCRRRKSYQEIDFDHSGITTANFLQLDFKTIQAATENFTTTNKLGEGGFGEVYKGTLVGGTEVAVKRLSKTSEQGAQEFKNEVVLVAKLQHRNLVRLLGFCLEGVEKILVYEFVTNKSLDYILFDSTKQGQLDWTKRYNIIEGITRGILYLHQDSLLRIIHRDIKASNILLDANMNPKIADFGMARISGIDQSVANTKRIAGTFGYMPPEYVIQGQFSMKSDVYSFGVLLLEIICGKKNSSFYHEETTAENLVTYAWRLWTNGTPLELLDKSISENFQSEEVTRCINVALLCVQKDPKHRPSMMTIMLMLTSNTLSLPVPQPPGFFLQSMVRFSPQTINDVTITSLDPR